MVLAQKIILITSGQPSLNPRLVKEADALTDAGYEVVVIYQYWNNWGTDFDKKLLAGKKWKAYLVGGSPLREKALYLKSRLSFKTAKFLTTKIGFKNKLAEQAIGRCTPLLIKKAKTIRAELYIAHNLAALPAAVLAAKKNKAKCGFDAEDFHRNEVTDNETSFDYRIKKYIEDKYLSQLDYLTTASPFISNAYQECYPQLKPNTLLNVFPLQHIAPMNKIDKPLQLFWFSQTVGSARGLETVIDALNHLDDSVIELHLLGYHEVQVTETFNKRLKSTQKNKIIYHPPIPADEIFQFASQFDIGLATELSSPKNRDICLTNKIFTYIQSGLAIIASDTSAQKKILDEYPNMGTVYRKNNPKSLAQAINTYINNRNLLVKHQKYALQNAKQVLNWEHEKEKFLSLILKTIQGERKS